MYARLAALASRIGFTGLAIAVLAALLAVQIVRLEGFKLWPLHMEGWKPKAERLQTDLDNVKRDQKAAADAAKAARLAEEARYRQLAEDTDAKLRQAQSRALDSAERFIVAHRLPARVAGPTSGAGAGSESDRAGGDHSAGGTADLASDVVAVSAEDVRICTRNTARLVAAHDWAATLNPEAGK
jgi:hypothetical protein